MNLSLLEGKIAGLSITRKDGVNPNGSMAVQLRGVTSLTGSTSPLIVIDGIPGGNMDLIQPEDIESIEVLKDGSAAAIYGSRANAGVILITTKSGKKGSTQVEYSTYFTRHYVATKPDFLTAEQYRSYKNDPANLKGGQMTDFGYSTDFFDEIIHKDNLTQSHNLSVSGGSENANYRASVFYNNFDGIGLHNSRQNYGGRISLNAKGWDDLLSLQMNLATNFNAADMLGGQYESAFTRNPTSPVYNEDGTYFETEKETNPVGYFNQRTQERDQQTTSFNTKATLTPIKDLNISIFGSVQRDADYTSSPSFCGWSGDFYHFAQRYIYGGDKNGNNGAVVIPSAFDMFDDKDLRKSQWMLIGPQYYYDDPTKPVKGTEEYRDKPLVFVKYIYRASEGKTEAESSMYNGEENSGARFNKYNPGISADRSTYWNNDWVLYRLTEIKYFKAEALMRKNGGVATQEAVDLINDCRQRAFSADDWSTFKYTTATLTLDELIKEKGREFIFEGKRRPDLIRFGKFVSTDWWDHKASNDVNKNIFPIPYTALTANSILEQNPGYNRE